MHICAYIYFLCTIYVIFTDNTSDLCNLKSHISINFRAQMFDLTVRLLDGMGMKMCQVS